MRRRSFLRTLAATGVGGILAIFPYRLAPSRAAGPDPGPASQRMRDRTLDGMTFGAGIVRNDAVAPIDEGRGSEPDGGASLRDTLVFDRGMFTSRICTRYNFAAAPYWVRLDGDRVHFLAELSSPTDGKMVWQGTIRDGRLEGTMRWTRTRWYWTVDVEHRIRGELLR